MYLEKTLEIWMKEKYKKTYFPFFQLSLKELRRKCYISFSRDLPKQGSNPSLLHWQADSLLPNH